MNDGATALFFAASNCQTDVLQLLIRNGADPNSRTDDGKTPLMVAAQNRFVDVMRDLLDKGADVNAWDRDGRTALMFAAQGGSTDAVLMLLDKGADVNARAHNGETAWAIASREGKKAVLRAMVAKRSSHAQASSEGSAAQVSNEVGKSDLRNNSPKKPTKQEMKMAISLAETLRRMAPKMMVQLGQNIEGEVTGQMTLLESEATWKRPASFGNDAKKLQSQLEKGANPQLVVIQGFEPGGVSHTGGPLGLRWVSGGNPGKIVPADRGGISLLDYCFANDIGDPCELLRKYFNKQ